MDFRILGPVELRGNDGRVELGPLKQRTVLAALLVDAGRPVTQELLIERVWDESPPAEVRNALYTYATRLRRILAAADPGEPARLVRRSGGYLLEIDPESVDAHRFARLAARARARGLSDGERAELARQALAQSAAVPLADLTCPWAARMREHFGRRRRDVLTLHAALEIRLGRPAAVVDDLYEALAAQPLAEELASVLMSALYFSGRSAEALNVYAATRGAIGAELGVEPGPDLRRVYEQILHGTLDGPPAALPDEPDARAAARPAAVVGEPAPGPAAPKTVIPSMLLADTPFHAGREREAAQAIGLLTPPRAGRTETPVVTLVGASGQGKTALAIHVAHRLKTAYPDGQLYLSLQSGPGTPDLSAALGRMLRALGVAPERQPDPADVEERAELYRGLLADRRILVVLDGAEDEEQIAGLLPASPGCGVLVTCRGHLAGIACARIALDVFDESAALRLLAAVVGEDRVYAEPEAARRLTAMCGNLPIAVRIAGSRLVARPRWPIARLVDRLADERRRLDELAHGQLDVRVSLGHTYRRMGLHAKALFRQLGRLEPDRFGPWPAPPLPGVESVHADEALEQLVDAQVVDLAGQDRHGRQLYRFGHLARLYARELASADGPGEREQRRRATAHREFGRRIAADRPRPFVLEHRAYLPDAG